MCNCNPNLTEEERYAQQVVIATPFEDYNKARIAVGLSPAVCIDPCILEEIKMLWSKGIKTHGCCCGHNNPDWYPFVNVADECIPKMLRMGYVQKHPDPTRRDTFLLKTI